VTRIQINWTWERLSALGPRNVYDLLRLRSDVFVVEQQCVFLDADGHDHDSWHLLGRDDAGALVAYLRVVDPGIKYPEPSIGRVVTQKRLRRTGLGRALMIEGIARTQARWPSDPIRIGAQLHLEGFYKSLGFFRAGLPYLEDGIDHIEMVLAAARLPELQRKATAI
jgi:ElaA protein